MHMYEMLFTWEEENVEDKMRKQIIPPVHQEISLRENKCYKTVRHVRIAAVYTLIIELITLLIVAECTLV